MQMALPSVTVISPQHSAPTQEVVLPGNVQPFISAPIFSRTNGYLRSSHADIGQHVKKGQLLAIVETPEVDRAIGAVAQQSSDCKGKLAARGDHTKSRYEGLLKTHAVAQQDADNAVGTYNANKAIVDANQANVKQLQTLQSFERIYAPFDGIITARNTDVGQLIAAGNTGNTSTDLFHISQPGKLRVYVNVPEQYSQAAAPGLTARLPWRNSRKKVQGKLVRTSNAINFSNRTLLVEVDVDNPTGELLSGAYAEVHLQVPSPTSAYLVPVSTLIFRSQGLQVAVVKDGSTVLTPVTAGRDYGDRVKIVAGLKGDESVMIVHR